jgi:uncharacterized membrane protein YjgN (DUF898 family)
MADTCPRCGHVGVESDRCPQCGAVASGDDAYRDRVRREVLSARVSAPAAAPAVELPASAGDARTVRRLFFHGRGSTLFGIYLVNIFLTLVTLGIYACWARVKVRKYLFSETEFVGDRFAYHGTGKELFLGYLKAGLVFGVPFYALRFLPKLLDFGRAAEAVGGLLSVAILAVFFPVAIVGARRYRLSRTSWRGIRCSFRGHVLDFAKVFLGGGLLTIVTLGFYYPYWITNRQAFMVGHSYFGSQPFRFQGAGRELLGSYLRALVLLIPTLGLSWFWFSAARHRYFARQTAFATARLESTVTGGGLLLLTLGNIGLLVLTLGIAFPWLIIRSLCYTIDRLTVRGPLDLEGIVQQPRAASATGEGLAGFFDTGFDLG